MYQPPVLRRLGPLLIPFLGLIIGTGATLSAAAQSTVTLLRVVDTDRFDPHTSTARAAGEILFMIGDTLVTLDYDLKTIQPGLATEWSISDDGRVYTFKLREDVTFCSGKPFTANDVVASVERWLDPATNGVTKWRAGDVKEVVATDDYTVEWRLNEPYAELLYQMAQQFHTIINVDQAEELGQDFGVKAIDTTGPFCFESWTPRDKTILTKHEAYTWGSPQFSYQTPQVDRIVWQITPEESPRLAAIQTGQSDATQYLPYWAIEQLRATPTVNVTQAEQYFWTYFVGMKITRDNVADEQVRRAINLAVDVDSIAEALFFGHAEPANAYIHPNVLDYKADMELSQFSYDIDQANQLLDAAGWTREGDGVRTKDGETLTLVAYGFNSPLWRQIMEAMQSDLRQVGVELDLQLTDPTITWGKLKTQEFDVFTMSYPYVSAGDALNLYFRSANMPTPNRMNWDDPEETDVWLASGSAALSEDERAQYYGQVQEKVHNATLWVPLAHEPLFIAAHQRLEPVKAHGIYGAGFYKGLELKLK
ncbi:MAG: ABC transporter substrate-binding protein [Candidatus Competibacterales bacterium]